MRPCLSAHLGLALLHATPRHGCLACRDTVSVRNGLPESVGKSLCSFLETKVGAFFLWGHLVKFKMCFSFTCNKNKTEKGDGRR